MLIEQLHDVITEHIPQEERAWLDPLKHSYLDLAEFLSVDEPSQRLVFRSIGNGRVYRVPDGSFRKELQPGQVLLTRLIREPGDVEWERAVIAGAAIVLFNEDGKGLLNATLDYRRQACGLSIPLRTCIFSQSASCWQPEVQPRFQCPRH